jgi:hypothetical protein
MDVKEVVEKVLNVKVESVEEIKERSFPLFDMVNMQGIKLALIKDPMFLIVGDDVYEKKMEGSFIIAEANGKYYIVRYSGEPNIEALRSANSQSKEEEPQEAEETVEEEDVVERGYEEEEEQGGEDDPAKDIVKKIPSWADGAIVLRKDNEIAVLPVKKSTKKEGAYYASTTWKPLDVQPSEDMVNHVITKNGKTIRANVYHGDRYINIFIRSSNRPRGGYYSGRRR